jgi:hypothetical protein
MRIRSRLASRDSGRRLLPGALTLGVVMLAAPAVSLAASAPKIASLSADAEETTATLKATIRPNGLETTYEFWMLRKGAFVAVGEGHIAPDKLEVEVRAPVYSLLAEHTYYWGLSVSNADGSAGGEVHSFKTPAPPPPGLPYGSGAGAPVEFHEEEWNLRAAERLASEAPAIEAEYRAKRKEEEERPAKEAAARAAKEREVREAGERAGREAAERERLALAAACVVPRVVGDGLRIARRALRAGHCRLGKVSGAKAGRGRVVIAAQGAMPGQSLSRDSAIAVTLVRRPQVARRH